MPSLQEYTNEIASLWNTHWLTNMGEKHKLFEKQLCEYLDTNNIALYTNGHSALECALEVLELKGKVITTPFSFASTTWDPLWKCSSGGRYCGQDRRGAWTEGYRDRYGWNVQKDHSAL